MKAKLLLFINLIKNIYFYLLYPLKYLNQVSWIPLMTTLLITLPLLALFRIKIMEQAYIYSQNTSKIQSIKDKHKKLKADYASLISIKNLQKLAKKHDFKIPREDQILFIP